MTRRRRPHRRRPRLVAMGASASSRGLVRKENQDRVLVLGGGRLVVLADGMGGMANGAMAARLAVDAAVRDIVSSPRRPAEQALRSAFDAAQAAIAAHRKAGHRIGGTTLTVKLQRNGLVLVGHCGDSPAFLLRNGQLTRITSDHRAPSSHVLLYSINGHGEVVPDIWTRPPRTGDLFCLCSDGITDMLRESTICRILRAYQKAPPRVSACALVRAALDAGGRDNATAATVKYGQALP